MALMVTDHMDEERAAKCLAELGSATRLGIYRQLVRAGPGGLSFGDIRARLEIPQSTLSHHVARLAWAGLITHTREGRSQRCRAVFETMEALMAFLADECCADERAETGQPATIGTLGHNMSPETLT